MKYEDGEEMNKHFLQFDKNIRDLTSIGATLKEIDIICHLLLTLPKSFDTLVTAIETIDPINLTLDFVKSRILDEFGKRRASGGNKSSPMESTAMYVKKSKPTCLCGKTGHMQFHCRSKQGTNTYAKPGRAKRANIGNEGTEEESEEELVLIASTQAQSAQRKPKNKDEIFGLGSYGSYGQ